MSKDRPYRDEEWLRQKYVDEKMTTIEIGEIAGCSSRTVSRYLREHGIETRQSGIPPRPENPEYRDESWLRESHWDDYMSTVEMAEECGVSQRTVCRWMDKHGIERRGNIKATRLKNTKPYNVHISMNKYGHVQAFSPDLEGGKDVVSIHRLTAVSKWGVGAVSGKVVHHKNHIPWDNRPGNLELMDHGEHTTHHNTY